MLTKGKHKRLYDFVGITFFSIDILKDLIVCWDARVLNSSMSNDRLFLLNHSCLNIHAMIRLHDQDYAR